MSKWPWIQNRVKGPRLVEIKNVDINNRKSRVHAGVLTYTAIYEMFNIKNYNFTPPTTADIYCLLLVG